MASTIQRNALIAPFSVRDDLIHVNERGKPTGKLAVTHQKWFTEAQVAINGTAQVTSTIPTSSTSPGQPGTIAIGDPNFVYICIGLNTWIKVAGSVF